MLEARHFGGLAAAPDAALASSVAVPSVVAARGPAPAALAPLPDDASRPLAKQVAEVERFAIAQALRASGGNRVLAARRLRMSRAALYDRLARWPELAGRA